MHAPDWFMYLPIGHWLHGPPLGPENPSLQMQAMTVLLPAGDVDPEIPSFPSDATDFKHMLPVVGSTHNRCYQYKYEVFDLGTSASYT